MAGKRKPKPSAVPPAEATNKPGTAAEASASGFPIVGIGASAGGLEAFEQLFRYMPSECNMAFVLVSHLDPDHASILASILQRSSNLPVTEAKEDTKVAPGHAYVIPPNCFIRIRGGSLQLSAPESPRGHRMPIDFFLHSLAEDQGERAVGVILSGTGTDGTLGLGAIIAAGGTGIVQDPATAKYDGMPRSAIGAGCATHVLAVEKIPQALIAGPSEHMVRSAAPSRTAPLTREPDSKVLARILRLLRGSSGHDFSLYKKSTVVRRIARRMTHHDIDDEEVYARYLKEHPGEQHQLLRELLINVTSFFRDPDAFAVLQRDVLAPLFAGKADDYVFRVWVAGCASGEEAYSIAILLRELMYEEKLAFKVQIYSTDLDEEAIAAARAGVYPQDIEADVSPERLQRYFVKTEAGFRVKKEVREMVVFAIQNVIKDPPFTRLDLLSCRNLLIYLEPELQDKLLLTFHYALKPNGVLFLSPSETIGNRTELFRPLDRKWRLYRASNKASAPDALKTTDLPWTDVVGTRTQGPEARTMRQSNFAELTRGMLLQTYAPPSLLTDLKGDILFVHGETRTADGAALGHPVGKPGHVHGGARSVDTG